MTNAVIDRAMRAAFKAWQDDMVKNGKTSALNAKFDDIAPRDRRLIELQCRAAIASLEGPTDAMLAIKYDNDFLVTGPMTKEAGDKFRRAIMFNDMIKLALKDT